MRDQIEYFFADLDLHIRCGKSPKEALLATVEDYAFVYHSDDDKTPLARAATIALRQIKDEGKPNSE